MDKYAPFGKYPKMSLERPSSSTPACTPTIPGFTCGLDATLRLISGKWKPLILYFVAQDGPTRYGALRRAMRDVSDKVLIQQLKELEADGLVKRTDYHEVPPRVDYSLTPLGCSLAEALAPLCAWGTANMLEVTRLYAARARAPQAEKPSA